MKAHIRFFKRTIAIALATIVGLTAIPTTAFAASPAGDQYPDYEDYINSMPDYRLKTRTNYAYPNGIYKGASGEAEDISVPGSGLREYLLNGDYWATDFQYEPLQAEQDENGIKIPERTYKDDPETPWVNEAIDDFTAEEIEDIWYADGQDNSGLREYKFVDGFQSYIPDYYLEYPYVEVNMDNLITDALIEDENGIFVLKDLDSWDGIRYYYKDHGDTSGYRTDKQPYRPVDIQLHLPEFPYLTGFDVNFFCYCLDPWSDNYKYGESTHESCLPRSPGVWVAFFYSCDQNPKVTKVYPHDTLLGYCIFRVYPEPIKFTPLEPSEYTYNDELRIVIGRDYDKDIQKHISFPPFQDGFDVQYDYHSINYTDDQELKISDEVEYTGTESIEDAGYYKIYYTSRRAACQPKPIEKTILIHKAESDLEISQSSYNVGEEPKPPTITSEVHWPEPDWAWWDEYEITEEEFAKQHYDSLVQPTITYTNKATGETSTEAPTTIGDYTVTVFFDETKNYKDATASADFSVTEGKLQVTTSNFIGEYDGQAHTASITCPDATLTYGLTANNCNLTEIPTFKNVGEHTIYYKATKDAYTTSTGSVTVTITKATPTLEVSMNNWKYGETASEPKIKTSLTDSVTPVFTYAKQGYADEYTTEKPTLPGRYIVKATINGTDNYNEVSDTCYFQIDAGKLNVSSSIYNCVYDGNYHTASIQCPGATITYGLTEGNYNLTEKPSFKEIGTHIIYFKAEKEGYETAYGTAEVVISSGEGGGSISMGNIEYGEEVNPIVSSITHDVSTATIYYKTATTDWTTVKPKNVGHYYIKAHLPANENYEEVYLYSEFDINIAWAPSTVPDGLLEVPYEATEITNLLLREYPGWEFDSILLGTELKVGEYVDAYVLYTAGDKDNYNITECGVTILRSACTHPSNRVVTEQGLDSTCSTLGYTAKSRCEQCGTVIQNSVPIPMKEHSWDAGTTTKEPTSTTTGIKRYECLDCDAFKEEVLPCTSSGGSGNESGGNGNESGGTGNESGGTGNESGGNGNGGNGGTETPIINPDGLIAQLETNEAVYNVYKTKSGGYEAKVLKAKNTKIKSVSIPSTLNYKGKKVKVVEIMDSAFANCKKLKTVTIGNNVKVIGKKAFYKCTKLKTLSIKTTKLTKKSIGSNAFKSIYKKAKFKVPKSKVKSYKKILKTKGMPKSAKVTK